MPQAGIDPPRHSLATYEASALPPSHHGWMVGKFKIVQISVTSFMNAPLYLLTCALLNMPTQNRFTFFSEEMQQMVKQISFLTIPTMGGKIFIF